MENLSWPFRHVVLTTCSIIGAGATFAGSAAAAKLPQGWIIGILLTTALAAIAFVSTYFALVRKKQRQDRADADWEKVQEALHELSAVERAIQDEIAAGNLDVGDCFQLTINLFRAALTCIQRAIEQLCPKVICSIKIFRRKAEEEYFECVYATAPSADHHGFTNGFKVLNDTNNFTGKAIEEDRIIFSGNLWKENETGNVFQYPYDKEVGKKLEAYGVQGLVVAPISLKNNNNMKFEAKAVFKIVYFVADGLVDNHPTKRTVEFVTARLGSLLQQSLMLSGSTIDDLTHARTPE